MKTFLQSGRQAPRHALGHTLCRAMKRAATALLGSIAVSAMALPALTHGQAVDPASLPAGAQGSAAGGTIGGKRQSAGADSTIHPIRGFLPDLDFELLASGGKTVTEKDFSGKVVMMFFGYASCPDICPTTMAQLTQVKESLGEAGEDVSIVFISVDPHRDTPDILKAYVEAFDSKAIGLTGTERQISRLARRYRVAYQIEKPRGNDQDTYEVAHSRGIYIFDDKGKARLLASDGESIEKLAAAVRVLLDDAS